MTKLDAQLDWLLQQVKAFVLSQYSGKITVDCKQGILIQIEKEPTLLLENGYAAEHELRRFRSDAKPGDTVTFVCRNDDKLTHRAKVVLKVPNA